LWSIVGSENIYIETSVLPLRMRESARLFTCLCPEYVRNMSGLYPLLFLSIRKQNIYLLLFQLVINILKWHQVGKFLAHSSIGRHRGHCAKIQGCLLDFNSYSPCEDRLDVGPIKSVFLLLVFQPPPQSLRAVGAYFENLNGTRLQVISII